jgi:branched-chain amino acid transport system permease protein
MFYLLDVASGLTSSYMLLVGLALVAVTLWFPGGIMGSLKRSWLPWLP